MDNKIILPDIETASVNGTQNNISDIEKEIHWVSEVIVTRYMLYFSLECEYSSIFDHIPPILGSDSPYGKLINSYNFSFDDRVAIALCLVSRLKPQILDLFFTKNKTYGRNFSEFGGHTYSAMGGFVPTGETLLFILAATNITERLSKYEMLKKTYWLFSEHLIVQEQISAGLPAEQSVIKLSKELEAQLIWNSSFTPEFGSSFPASLLETKMTWDDLVLSSRTKSQISEIITWIKHGNTLLGDWNMGHKLRPGLRCLFYGPPGTGKTLTASLLGKENCMDVYRVDLSLTISKYIGETEKNLSKIFDMASSHNWILFFDEADALFGKRTQVQDAHDRYANQEVSYLLQRVETFNGIVILATNMKNNIDEAFSRRFESMVQFQMPRPQERSLLWQKGFSEKAHKALGEDVDLNDLAMQYELSGASIMNVIRYVSLLSIESKKLIFKNDLIAGIRREFAKEGKSI